MRVRLTHIDGSMPNIALMKLSHWHKGRGDDVVFTKELSRREDELEYDRVYGSSIFGFSQLRTMLFQREWPNAIVGGTGTPSVQTVEEIIGEEYEFYDYSCYPDVEYSIGFFQRGCRLSCKFCVVPKKEGKPRSVNTVSDLWRGDPHPRKLHILDNDFFGNPEWRDRIKEIRDGKFKVCLSQGINTRLIDDEAAEALASIEYRDTKFERRRLYTAWDNLKDEGIFFKGVDRLKKAGIPPHKLMVYMLVGYDKNETWDRIWYRFDRMITLGIMPYPMVFDRSRKDLCAFQRWINTGLYNHCKWSDYDSPSRSDESTKAYINYVPDWLKMAQKEVGLT
jgi:hypothetical protein